MLIDCRNDRPPGLLLIIVGPSGSGKTSLADFVIRDFSGAVKLVSHTTRPPRPGEVSGRDYHFISRREFEEAEAAGDFLEWQEIYGNLYGTSRREIERQLSEYAIVVAVLDIRGALIAREAFGSRSLLIGIWSHREDLLARLLARGASEEDATRRLAEYDHEMGCMGSCDVCLFNPEGRFDECKDSFFGILRKRLFVMDR